MCRLNFDGAEASAASESDRVLAREWTSFIESGRVDTDALLSIESDRGDSWLRKLVFAYALTTNDPSVLGAFDRYAADPNYAAWLKMGPARSEPAQKAKARFRWTGQRFVVVKATIQAQEEWVLLDTGATATAITPGLASQLELRADSAAPIEVNDAGGNTTSAQMVAASIAISGVRVSNTPVMVHELPASIFVQDLDATRVEAILGWTVISRFRWEFFRRGRRVSIREGGATVQDGVDVTWTGEPIVRVTINGVPGLALLDMGSQHSAVTAFGVQRLGLETRPRRRSERTAFGEAPTARLLKPAAIQVGNATVRTRVSSGTGVDPTDDVCVDAVLGIDALWEHRVLVLDGPARRVRFGPPDSTQERP